VTNMTEHAHDTDLKLSISTAEAAMKKQDLGEMRQARSDLHDAYHVWSAKNREIGRSDTLPLFKEWSMVKLRLTSAISVRTTNG